MIKLIILYVIIVIFFSTAVFTLLNHGLKLHEASECLKWQAEAEIYPDYYLTEWQKAQCLNYEISL